MNWEWGIQEAVMVCENPIVDKCFWPIKGGGKVNSCKVKFSSPAFKESVGGRPPYLLPPWRVTSLCSPRLTY